MRVVVAGAGGLIGAALREAYAQDGATVVRLVRCAPRGPNEVWWDPAVPDPGLVAGADVVVNLAGAGIGDRRWTRRYRETIRSSRLISARTLAAAAAEADPPPGVVLSMSGIRYYGIDRGDEVLTETSGPGRSGLLCTVTREWEEAMAATGIRVCHLRTGLVLSGRGGLLPPLLRLFRTGVGAYFGSGLEHWSHLSLIDTVRAIRFLAGHPDAAGAYNLSAPQPLPNRELLQVLGELVGVRLMARIPLPVARVAIGQLAVEVFGSLRVVPARLEQAGFAFTYPDAESTLRAALAEVP